MLTAVTAFIIAALAAGVLTPLVRELAVRRGLLDHAHSSRKVHGRPVPRLGGLAIVAAFCAPLLGLLLVTGSVERLVRSEPREVMGLLAGGLAVVALGIYDDVRGANAWKKLSVQLAVGALMYALGFRIDVIAHRFGADIQLGALGLPFTMLWFAGVMNALNLIDGLDGLAGGVALIGIGSTFAVAALRGDALMMLLCAALAGAVLGFLFYNFSPASIFMGDTGSMFLGFVLAAAAIQTSQKSSTAVALLAPVVALGLPIGDTLLAMLRRLVRGRPMFHADREHVHHLLLAKGWSHGRACLALYAVALVLGASGVALARVASGWFAALVLAALVAGGAVFLRWLGYARLERAPGMLELRRRNLERRARVRAIAESLRHASDPVQIWETVRQAAPALGADFIGLTLPGASGRAERFATFVDGPGEAGNLRFRVRQDIVPERAGGGVIELGWTDRAALDRDTEIAVEQLCHHLASAVERIDRLRPAPAPGELRLRRGA
jgi:UDP-GlcNAc:undecaprenyl-phosphate GlcNAc-1-phosphate transferase